MKRCFLLCGLLIAAAAFAQENKPSRTAQLFEKASWIWDEPEISVCHLRKVFTLKERPASAIIHVTADNGYQLYVNGSYIGSDSGAGAEWKSVEQYDIQSRLLKGKNVIGIEGTDLGGPRGVAAAVRIEMKGQPPVEFVTDENWRAASVCEPSRYSRKNFVEGMEWRAAKVVSAMGAGVWGKLASSPENEAERSKNSPPEIAPPDKDFSWPEGVAFLGDDCSVYVAKRKDAWGVCFRVGNWTRAYTEFDLPCPSKIGRKLYTLKPGPGAKPRLLFDAGTGVMGSPSVSFDGQFLLVALAREGEKFFHIYRIPVGGGEPQRLTDGPFHDIDPVELPDGRIVFTSTRIGTFEEYHGPPARALFVMNSDSSEIHPITHTAIFDSEPKVMADGRIVFIRSDNFFDRAKVETHLHVIRPDGTDGFMEIGAEVGAGYGVRLRAFGYGSPAPMPDGRIAFISSRGNFIAAPGATEKNFHPLPAQLGDIAALPDSRLLCTVLRPDQQLMSSDVLGVIDPKDNQVTGIFESPFGAIHSPVFLGARPRPSIIPNYVSNTAAEQPGKTGFLFCQNVRFTEKTKGDWNRVRAIRVLGAAPLTVRSSHSHIVHMGHETIELGTVPLAPDGSFFVEVPADIPLALQAVDAEGRPELNEMSWLYVRPGERRSCLGCHNPRNVAAPLEPRRADALRTAPLKLVGQGDAHRSRGNNPGVTGFMDLQFDRFRECASLNRHNEHSDPLASSRTEIHDLLKQLAGTDDALKISAAQRLAIFRTREAAPALAARLIETNREVRVAAALALAPCGTRESVPALLAVLDDNDPTVAQAAAVALENISGHAEPFDAYAATENRQQQAESWRKWFAANSWETIERALIVQLQQSNSTTNDTSTRNAQRNAVIALGHIGGEAARTALCEFVTRLAKTNPYPVFENHNRTDTFTFSAESPLNPRTLQEALRAIGHLRDTNAVSFLRELITANIEPTTGNLFLAEAAIEALGHIATQEAETALIETFAALKPYWEYVGWYSDHPALYACHSSPLHARVIEALDLMESSRAGNIVPQLISSVPTDPDRALFLDNDDYETLVGRLIRRSGRGAEVVETCLALLGDADAKPQHEIKNSISTTHPAWAGHPGPENRAAQILSLVCRNKTAEPRIRAAFTRFQAMREKAVEQPSKRTDMSLPEFDASTDQVVKRTLDNPAWTPVRQWVLFYLGRSLGQLGDSASVETLEAALKDDLNEARFGRPDPSQPEIHFLHLEYTPCWRASAAWALGQIGDHRAVPALLAAARNLENSTDVRHAAAQSLERIADKATLPDLQKLSANYPEISTRRVLQAACAKIEKSAAPRQLARANDRP